MDKTVNHCKTLAGPSSMLGNTFGIEPVALPLRLPPWPMVEFFGMVYARHMSCLSKMRAWSCIMEMHDSH